MAVFCGRKQVVNPEQGLPFKYLLKTFGGEALQ